MGGRHVQITYIGINRLFWREFSIKIGAGSSALSGTTRLGRHHHTPSTTVQQ